MRKRIWIFWLAASVEAFAVENALPEARPADRYNQALEHSPFALATKVEEPTEPKASFAANWLLTGLARFPDDAGVQRDFVTIRSRDQRVAFSLFGDEVGKDGTDADGVSVARVDRSPDLRKSTVTLKKGNEMAKIEFSQETALAAPMATAPGVPPANAPLVNPNIPRTANPPAGQRTSPNAVRPLAPGQLNPAANAGVRGGGPGTGGGPGVMMTTPQATGRRRIIPTPQ